MIDSDRLAFAELFMGLAEIYSEPVSAARIELSFQLLRDLPLAAVQRAALAHAQRSKFFPRPAELREAIEGTVEDRAEIAWNAVRAEIRRVGWLGTPRWPDEATKRTALDVFGSWRGCCEQMPESGPEMLGLAKCFRQTYAAYAHTTSAPALPSAQDDAKVLEQRLREIAQHTSE